MMDDKSDAQSKKVDLANEKNNVSSSQEQVNDSTVQLSPKELNKALTEKYDNLAKEHVELKKTLLKSLLKKYQIRESINLNAVNFKSFEDAETSLLNYCEKNNVSYSNPSNERINVYDSSSKFNVHAKKYFLL